MVSIETYLRELQDLPRKDLFGRSVAVVERCWKWEKEIVWCRLPLRFFHLSSFREAPCTLISNYIFVSTYNNIFQEQLFSTENTFFKQFIVQYLENILLRLVESGNTLKTQNSPFQQYNPVKSTILKFFVIRQNIIKIQ